MLCFEAASCHCYTIREGEWASQEGKKGRYGQEAENKARRKLDRKEIEGKKGITVLQVFKGALILRKKVLF